MLIEISCTSCGRRMRVDDSTRGTRIRCPKCQNPFTVPGDESPVAEPASGPRPRVNPPQDRWYLTNEEQEEFGPVPKSELDGWVAEGLVTAECQVLREGEDAWKWASDVFPELKSPQLAFTPDSVSEFAIDTGTANPYSSPAPVSDASRGGNRRKRAHRGTTVLVMGILGWLLCAVFGVVAWMMGASDLKDMRAGRMDPSGRSMTQTGMILGMIQTILAGLVIIVVIMLAIFGSLLQN